MIIPILILSIISSSALLEVSSEEVSLYAEGNETEADFFTCAKPNYTKQGSTCIFCFNMDTRVMTADHGEVELRYLKPGDKILTVSHEGELKYEEMIADGHRVPDVETSFYNISVGGKSIMITPGHYVYTGEDIDSIHLIRADEVKPGDFLLLTTDSAKIAYSTNLDAGSNLDADPTNLNAQFNNLDVVSSKLDVMRVDKVEKVLARGISNPLLPSGRILVEGILASVYSDEFAPLSVAQQHGSLWMIRQICNLIPNAYSSLISQGLPSLSPYLAVVDKYFSSG